MADEQTGDALAGEAGTQEPLSEAERFAVGVLQIIRDPQIGVVRKLDHVVALGQMLAFAFDNLKDSRKPSEDRLAAAVNGLREAISWLDQFQTIPVDDAERHLRLLRAHLQSATE